MSDDMFDNKQEKDSKPISDQAENIFEPSLASRFETNATRFVIKIYREVICDELTEDDNFDNDLIEDALDEWHDLALDPDRWQRAGESLQHTEALDRAKQIHTRVRGLPIDSDWNAIIVDAISDFDGPIKTGLECGWNWERIFQLYLDSLVIDAALQRGLHPDVSADILLKHINQKDE